MRLTWLEAIYLTAATHDIKIAARMMERESSWVQRVIRNVEGRWGCTLFHRLPWLNKTDEHAWEIADDHANHLILQMAAIKKEIEVIRGMALYPWVAIRPQGLPTLPPIYPWGGIINPSAYKSLRMKDIERTITLRGNTSTTAGKICGIKRTHILGSATKIERWLGVKIFDDLVEGTAKFKMLTLQGQAIFPHLEAIVRHWGEIKSLTTPQERG